MNNPNLAVSMRKRRQETIARQKRKREQREYVGNISVRNIVRNLAKLSKEEQGKRMKNSKGTFLKHVTRNYEETNLIRYYVKKKNAL